MNIKDRLAALSLSPADSVTATENGTGVDLQNYIVSLAILLDCEAGSGSSPTLDIKIQDSADNSTWADVSGATFTQVTDSALAFETISLDVRSVDRYIRTVATLAGSSPVFVYGVTAQGEKSLA